MAAKIEAAGDTIKVDKAFVSGKDRIAVNGEVVYEGKLIDGAQQEINIGHRVYRIELRKVSKMTGAMTIHLQIEEGTKMLHSGVYDQLGKTVSGDGQAKSNSAIQVCAMVGMAVGVAFMIALSRSTGAVPGGAIGGAIGGGVGGGIGFGIGTLLFGRE